MKKIFAIILISLLAAACNKNAAQTENPPQNDWQTYHYQPYNFKFEHPRNWPFTQALRFGAEEPIVAVITPRDLMPGTNFSDAAFTIGVTPNSSAQKCFLNTETSRTLSETKQLGKVIYYVYKRSEAAAGNLYQSTIFKRLDQSVCFELVQTIHSTNLGNYEPGTIKEFDPKEVQVILDKITGSFDLLN